MRQKMVWGYQEKKTMSCFLQFWCKIGWEKSPLSWKNSSKTELALNLIIFFFCLVLFFIFTEILIVGVGTGFIFVHICVLNISMIPIYWFLLVLECFIQMLLFLLLIIWVHIKAFHVKPVYLSIFGHLFLCGPKIV